MLDRAKEIEGLELMDINSENNDDRRYETADYWKSVLFAVKINERELEELKRVRDEVVQKYNEVVSRKQKTVDDIKEHIVNFLPRSPFKTKNGGYSFCLYPHIGEIKLSSEVETITVPESAHQNFIDQGFNNIKVVFNKELFNKRYKPIGGKLLDITSGEEINPADIGVSITSKRRITIK